MIDQTSIKTKIRSKYRGINKGAMRRPQKRGVPFDIQRKKESLVITVCGLYYVALYLHYSVALNLPERKGTDNLLKTK